ncbi:hypothetical protein [Streptomyces sp. 147326]|uniref:hypothetical protein n=1 Tax=Streptomyces sp. 147326 TaxID=3074379 RepID=UPI00385792C2
MADAVERQTWEMREKWEKWQPQIRAKACLAGSLQRLGERSVVYTEPMARAVVEPAMQELMRLCTDGREHSTTVALGGDGFTMYGHVRVRPGEPGHADVSLACWTANMDTARYCGSDPPSEDEARLPPEGTATPDESLTNRVIGHLVIRMNALDGPRPDRDGHLTITVPFASQ